MLFKDYKIGFADAEKEYLRTPEIFKDAFFDVNGILDELINKYKFLLIFFSIVTFLPIQFLL